METPSIITFISINGDVITVCGSVEVLKLDRYTIDFTKLLTASSLNSAVATEAIDGSYNYD